MFSLYIFQQERNKQREGEAGWSVSLSVSQSPSIYPVKELRQRIILRLPVGGSFSSPLDVDPRGVEVI